MDMPRLKMALQHAVDVENYELASKLRDEINNRRKPAND
jgi:protein-arginine kinase activator protein McsA